jgi:hypothetical protein
MVINTEEKLDVINCLSKVRGLLILGCAFGLAKSTVYIMLNN